MRARLASTSALGSPATTGSQLMRARITAFAMDLARLVRQAVVEQVGSALDEAEQRGPARAGELRARSPAEVDALTGRLAAWIRTNPGGRIGDASRALGASRRALALPLSRLLASRTFRKTGTRRGTRYFAN